MYTLLLFKDNLSLCLKYNMLSKHYYYGFYCCEKKFLSLNYILKVKLSAMNLSSDAYSNANDE